ncbi:MAG: hypothetical protein ACJAZN_000888 [Planctomycetota bacterium]|jgi:hypothetical protein
MVTGPSGTFVLSPLFISHEIERLFMTQLQVEPGATARTVRNEKGETLNVPENWALLPPGDAAATLRVKKAGDHWVVSEKRGRKRFSRGVWAPQSTITQVTAALELERLDPAYQRKLDAGRVRRDRQQVAYVEEFFQEVLTFLDFPLTRGDLARTIARAVTDHATPVGSGTVARTKRISTDRRAEAAVIAWMRHQTTAYDSMKIARVKGRRREVRRELAQRSSELLNGYRRGDRVDNTRCPLAKAVADRSSRSTVPEPKLRE